MEKGEKNQLRLQLLHARDQNDVAYLKETVLSLLSAQPVEWYP